LTRFAQTNSTATLSIEVLDETKPGACAARNRGLEAATTQWVMFFDSDDTMPPTLIQNYAAVIERHHGELDIVCAPATLHFTDGSTRQLPFYTTDFFANQILHSLLSTQRYIVRRSFFEQAGRWNDELPAWNDYEMGMRLAIQQPRVAFLDKGTGIDMYHSGEQSITGVDFASRHGYWEHVLDIMQQHLDDSDVKNKKRYRRLLEYRRIVLAAQYKLEGHDDLATELYDQYITCFKHNPVQRLVVPMLYRRIAAGKRGSARIARLIIK
ncbi:MAG: glycosyltransferase family 2 protein, partial [Muribaculaceae bacterium]|nr:glycosyltransferase family 2 protein [Muribaculaceae bacterium]